MVQNFCVPGNIQRASATGDSIISVIINILRTISVITATSIDTITPILTSTNVIHPPGVRAVIIADIAPAPRPKKANSPAKF